MAFFEQDQETCLDKNKTVLEEAESVVHPAKCSTLRGLLGSFLFPGDDVVKKIAVLSGGAKNRVAMVKVLLPCKLFNY
jgi:ATP-binding cassette subfamily F protein 3